MKTREEKFARILAIADMLGRHSFEWNRPTVEHHYRTKFSKNPAKTLQTIHKDLMAYSNKWDEKQWMLFEVLGDAIADLDLDEFNNKDLDEMFNLHLSKSKVEMWNMIGVEEAAEILGLSPGTVKNYCAEGKIEAKKIGKTWVIDKTKLEEKKMNFKTVGTWWNDREIELVEIEGKVYALHGWNGEKFIDSWECTGENNMDASEEKYIIAPVYKEVDEDEFEIVRYEVE